MQTNIIPPISSHYKQWAVEEDEKLLTGIQQCGDKWKAIVLHYFSKGERTGEQCQSRYKYYWKKLYSIKEIQSMSGPIRISTYRTKERDKRTVLNQIEQIDREKSKTDTLQKLIQLNQKPIANSHFVDLPTSPRSDITVLLNHSPLNQGPAEDSNFVDLTASPNSELIVPLNSSPSSSSPSEDLTKEDSEDLSLSSFINTFRLIPQSLPQKISPSSSLPSEDLTEKDSEDLSLSSFINTFRSTPKSLPQKSSPSSSSLASEFPSNKGSKNPLLSGSSNVIPPSHKIKKKTSKSVFSKSSSHTRYWSEEEDKKLIKAIQELGQDWKEISLQYFSEGNIKRTAKQCQNRYITSEKRLLKGQINPMLSIIKTTPSHDKNKEMKMTQTSQKTEEKEKELIRYKRQRS